MSNYEKYFWNRDVDQWISLIYGNLNWKIGKITAARSSRRRRLEKSKRVTLTGARGKIYMFIVGSE